MTTRAVGVQCGVIQPETVHAKGLELLVRLDWHVNALR
jgi:hypothetical protein